jgi:hypothetical protein
MPLTVSDVKRGDVETCVNAARSGRLKVLKYAHENGCPWNEETCINAAMSGRLEVLKYAYENGCPINKYSGVPVYTHHKIKEWLINNT